MAKRLTKKTVAELVEGQGASAAPGSWFDRLTTNGKV